GGVDQRAAAPPRRARDPGGSAPPGRGGPRRAGHGDDHRAQRPADPARGRPGRQRPGAGRHAAACRRLRWQRGCRTGRGRMDDDGEAAGSRRPGAHRMISVLLVDDQSLLRLGFRMVLEAEDDLQVVGEAADGATAVRMARELTPDVVLMDVRMPGTNGIEATAQITADLSGCKVIILTTFDLDEYAFAGLRAGASGFQLKDSEPSELVAAIRTVHSGDAVVSPRITRRMLEMFADRLPEESTGSGAATAPPEPAGDLTAREQEVLLAIAEGLSNSEIAARLYVSEATVKTHVGKVL